MKKETIPAGIAAHRKRIFRLHCAGGMRVSKAPSDEGAVFCEAKDWGREHFPFLFLSLRLRLRRIHLPEGELAVGQERPAWAAAEGGKPLRLSLVTAKAFWNRWRCCYSLNNKTAIPFTVWRFIEIIPFLSSLPYPGSCQKQRTAGTDTPARS